MLDLVNIINRLREFYDLDELWNYKDIMIEKGLDHDTGFRYLYIHGRGMYLLTGVVPTIETIANMYLRRVIEIK